MLIYPAVLDYVETGGICCPVQDCWMSLGGELSWSDGCCMWLHGDSMAFECRSCTCGGCTSRLTYRYEGYAISVEGPSCGCASGNGSGGVGPPPLGPDEPDVSIAFDKRHVLLSTSCLGYGSRSTGTELTISANGGVRGGVLEWGVENAEKLSAGEGDLPLNGFCPLSPNGTFSGARVTVGATVSDRPRDVRAWAVLYESGTGVRHARESRTTVCRVSVDQIRFNYNFQSYHNDAINIRPNSRDDYDYSNGEWCGGGATNNPACYVGTCRPNVRARFKVEPSGIADACVRALASSQEFTLGDLPATDVVFSGSNSQWTVFETLDGEEIGWYVNKTSARWDWILSEIESESFQPFWTDSTGPHTIYTVLAHPTVPWEAAHSATQRPWASALDFACLTAKGARSANAALTAITQKLFLGMGFSLKIAVEVNSASARQLKLAGWSGYDAVEARERTPTAQVFGRHQAHEPVAAALRELRDAVQELPPERPRRLNEQRYFLHGGGHDTILIFRNQAFCILQAFFVEPPQPHMVK